MDKETSKLLCTIFKLLANSLISLAEDFRSIGTIMLSQWEIISPHWQIMSHQHWQMITGVPHWQLILLNGCWTKNRATWVPGWLKKWNILWTNGWFGRKFSPYFWKFAKWTASTTLGPWGLDMPWADLDDSWGFASSWYVSEIVETLSEVSQTTLEAHRGELLLLLKPYLLGKVYCHGLKSWIVTTILLLWHANF